MFIMVPCQSLHRIIALVALALLRQLAPGCADACQRQCQHRSLAQTTAAVSVVDAANANSRGLWARALYRTLHLVAVDGSRQQGIEQKG